MNFSFIFIGNYRDNLYYGMGLLELAIGKTYKGWNYYNL